MPNQGLGFACVGIGILCFGSNFVPVKKFETGDGIFFQWVLCAAIWISGLVVNLIRTHFSNGMISTVTFYPFAMLGGALWCMGNAMAVTIIKCIGLSLGMCLWGSVSLMVGWSAPTWGLFGIKEEKVANPTLNFIGAGIAVLGVVFFAFIKPEQQAPNPTPSSLPHEEVKLILTDPYRVNDDARFSTPQASFVERLSPTMKRVLGISLSVASGFLYGVNFDPPQIIIDHGSDVVGISTKQVDYVFSHFSGIFAMSTLIFLGYALIMRNKPMVYPEAILPGFVSGLLWSFAQISWFVANSNLPMVITFPMYSTGPGLLASLWGVVVFKEIKGRRNLALLAAAFVVVISAAVCIALSNK
eukprot:TRINITY_DN2352_c0_g1_i3.p1 TRINITY_DN2352_c0_g1~~TRINITY_DN2352_c0_g1_i3.p1  ORF type:complete len:357 (-),score=71.53 TRINITY_DN2352_c0_g1_i3:16-1086(-)